jgi:hypothetical protein
LNYFYTDVIVSTSVSPAVLAPLPDGLNKFIYFDSTTDADLEKLRPILDALTAGKK